MVKLTASLLLCLLCYFEGYGQQMDSLINIFEGKRTILKERQASIYDTLELLKLKKIRNDLAKVGLPDTTEGVIFHSAMALQYNEKHEQAQWVAHIILPDIVNLNQSRSNDFRPDPKVHTGTAVQEDYFLTDTLDDGTVKYDGFGYDRGHLAPSADFRWSAKALSESYYYSNMSPQMPEFNREIWAELENFIRTYVLENEVPLFVTTGPFLNDDLPIVEQSLNQISIPQYYFKTVVDIANKRALAFVIANQKAIYPLESYATSIDEIEAVTGLDFYKYLPDDLENELERQSDIKPFQPINTKGDVAPIAIGDLPKGAFNTMQAKYHVNTGKTVTVCGKVVSATKSARGNTFLNLDQSFPDQIFSISIFKNSHVNFTYEPSEYLIDKNICVKGEIGEFQGTPSMIIESPKKITTYNTDLLK